MSYLIQRRHRQGRDENNNPFIADYTLRTYVSGMRRWFGYLLALVLSLSVIVPARLHAMAQGHQHGAPATAHAGHGHDCEPADRSSQSHSEQDSQAQKQHAICLAACACLPVTAMPPALTLRLAGRRLDPPLQIIAPSREPEMPLKPPKRFA